VISGDRSLLSGRAGQRQVIHRRLKNTKNSGNPWGGVCVMDFSSGEYHTAESILAGNTDPKKPR